MLPDVIDRRFHLEREVGGGGMGRTWRALRRAELALAMVLAASSAAADAASS